MKQTILHYKGPVLIAALGILILILVVVSIVFLAAAGDRSLALIYQIDTKILSETEIEDVANEYLIPTLKQRVPEKEVEFNWEYSTNSIQVSTVSDAQTIRKLKEFNKVIELQLPAYVKQKELLQRHKSAKALQQLEQLLTKYAKNNNGKYPDSLDELEQYNADNLLIWAYEHIMYLGKGESLASNFQTPIAYDRVLLKKGNGTNILFNDRYVGFEKPMELEKYGIVRKTQ